MDFQASSFQDEDFNFNDPYTAEPEQITGSNAAQSENSSKLKRTACVLCRKRKLRCDTARPKCGTCDRLGHDCEYNEIRKKSGPKRGYVKALEARLCTQAHGLPRMASPLMSSQRKSRLNSRRDLVRRMANPGKDQVRSPMGSKPIYLAGMPQVALIPSPWTPIFSRPSPRKLSHHRWSPRGTW